MAKIPIPIANGFYVDDSLPISNQECINWIPILSNHPALSIERLIGAPGIRSATTTGSTSADANRGAWKKAGIPYFVNGDELFSLERSYVSGVETFSATSLGTISGTGRVSMSDNGIQLMVLVPGGSGYIYNEDAATPFQEITASGFTANGNPQHVVFCDGYFICSTDSKKWIISALNDGLTWSALDVGSAESDPDNIVSPVVHNNQVFITGSQTTEGFQNVGGSGFPFQRNNIILDKGCYAAFTLVNSNQTFFMLGGGKNERAGVWGYQGGQFTKVSNDAVDNVISGYSDAELEASFALAYGKRDQYLVAFNLYDRTLVYNITTGLWHEQKSTLLDSDSEKYQGRWRVNSLVTAYGHTIVGDSEDGRIGILEFDTYKEYDYDIVRIFTTIPASAQGDSLRIPSIELTMEAGVGNSDVEDPVVSMAISRDGKTWGNERPRKIGKVGKYEQRTVWRKNGRIPRYGTFKFRLSDAVKPVVIKLEADIT